MSRKHNITPIEIPELLHLIGCHLLSSDLKSCMLVSRTWHTIFEAYLWHDLHYNSQCTQHLEQHGHLVRRLKTYNLSTKDLYLVAGSCHFVQQLTLDVGGCFLKLSPGLETIVANMPHITDLTLGLPGSTYQMYFCAISRLKQLRYLTLTTINRLCHSTTCDLLLLLNVIQECTRLCSLTVENIIVVDQSTPGTSPLLPTQSGTDVMIYPPGFKQWWNSAWFRQLKDKVRHPEDPWRKFEQVTHVENQVRPGDESFLCTPDASRIYPLLTRLVIKNLLFGTTKHQSLPFGLLFKKTPHLRELYIEFKRFWPTLIAECLNAITANCKELAILTFDGLRATVNSQTSINEFFRTIRPGLQRLTLKKGVDLEGVLDLIPERTANGLHHLRLEDTVWSHAVLHRFLQRCSSLQSLAWSNCTEMTIDSTMRFSACLVEPWTCYDTLRHVEFRVTKMDKDSFDAYFGRLAQAEQLVSLSVSLCDLRRSIIKRGEDARGWYFPLVQELTMAAGYTLPLCSLDELRYTLQAFPKLRKIRYEGTQYPLDDEARHSLMSQGERSVMVIHTTQTPSFVY
ncbi:hypothetical protein BGZ70_004201 [Mortierella alpina]|uniref:F-box domain-containing protein n=1 Tax=Mortierella alpina TaxID=64518 RepID=A0A9P6IRL2_MORAP|nr:hypothetical protein BGZ70_004201 [Mortierella alpina]